MTKQTYGQELPYVEWRAKQNFDYAYLMRYSSSLSNYYVQLEDDVITAPRYIANLRQFEQKVAKTEFHVVCLAHRLCPASQFALEGIEKSCTACA